MAKRSTKKSTTKNTKRNNSRSSKNVANSANSTSPHASRRAKGPSSLKTRRRGTSTPHRRITTSLSQEQTRLIANALQHADRILLPLNRMITVDWTLAGILDPHSGRQHLLRLIYDWMRTRGCASAYVWVMENGPKFGVHSHILIHVPPRLRRDFNRLFRSWRKQVGIPWKRHVVHSRHIGLTADAAFSWGDRASYMINASRALAYILKGATATGRRMCKLRLGRTQFSTIAGKRCGTSRNLGRAAILKFDAEGGTR